MQAFFRFLFLVPAVIRYPPQKQGVAKQSTAKSVLLCTVSILADHDTRTGFGDHPLCFSKVRFVYFGEAYSEP